MTYDATSAETGCPEWLWFQDTVLDNWWGFGPDALQQSLPTSAILGFFSLLLKGFISVPAYTNLKHELTQACYFFFNSSRI